MYVDLVLLFKLNQHIQHVIPGYLIQIVVLKHLEGGGLDCTNNTKALVMGECYPGI